MQSFLQDLRYALRTLTKDKGFALVAILTLALGIGANTAIFSVVNAVLLRPLAFPDSGRLMVVWHVPPQKSFPGMTRFAVAPANYLDWKAQNHVFEQMTIYTGARFNLTGKGEPQTIQSAAVSSEFFSVLRVSPKLGRSFSSEEDQPGHNHVVILGRAIWQTHFGSDPNIIGKQIAFDGLPYTVIGVMDAGFRRPSWAQVWTPLAMTGRDRAVRGEHHYLCMARLKPDADLKQAQAEMSTISRRLELEYPDDDKGWGALVVPLREELVGEARPALLILLGAVAFVLLIACANVANLALAKTLSRRKGIAIRTALGASRGRVLRQALFETVALSIAGGALGVYLAQFGVALIVHFFGEKLPRGAEISLDAWVLVFALAISVLAGILAGIAPAWRVTKSNVNELLKQGLGRTASDSAGSRTRSAFVVAEVALSLVLVVGAGLMIRSLRLLGSVNPGFEPANLLTMTLGISAGKFDLASKQATFISETLQKVRAVPGVESAGVVDSLPLSGGSNQPILIEGRPAGVLSEQPEVAVRAVSPDYLPAMHIQFLEGRDFTDADTMDRPAVVVISESMARRFWPNENPVGKHLTLSFFPDRIREIAGVVRDVKIDALDEADPSATLYVPIAQLSAPLMGGWRSFPVSLVVRAKSHASSLATAVVGAVHQEDKEVPVANVMTMNDYLADTLSPQRFNMQLLTAFAGLALLLAAVGIYSVLSYAVRRRAGEIGIRMALGAQRSDVLRLVVGHGLRLTLVGLAIGIAGAFAVTRLMAKLLFGVAPTDAVTFVAVTALLCGIALLACVIPAYRATRVDPLVALRYE
jgi:putative ABC transport system permease protein